VPGIAAVRGLKQSAARRNERFATANFQGATRATHSTAYSVRELLGSITRSAARCFHPYTDLLKRLAAVRGAKHAALGVRPIGVPQSSNEQAVGVLRVDDNGSDLLGVPQTQVLPGLPASVDL